jgi:PAS domain S-box-containing protein
MDQACHESSGDRQTGSREPNRTVAISERYLKMQNRITTAFLLTGGEKLYAEVLRVVLEELRSPFGYFGYIDENGDLVSPSLTRDIWDKCEMPHKSIVFPRSSWGGLWGRSLIEKRTMVANGELQPPRGHIALSCALAVPILFGEELVGQLAVANKQGGYDDGDVRLLETIVRSIAPLLKARLEAERHDTGRRRAEEELWRFRAALDNSADAIFLIDREEMRFIDGNATACRSLGYDRESLLKLGPQDIKPEYDRDDLARVFDAVIGGDDSRSVLTTTHRRRDGTCVPVEVVLRSISSLDRQVMIASVRDITDRLAAEKALRQAHEELEQKVAERTRDLSLSNTLLKDEIDVRRRAESRVVNVNRLLELAARSSTRAKYLEGVVALVREWSGCRHVGIRLVNGGEIARFAAWDGYDEAFLATERCVDLRNDHCICARVLRGACDTAEGACLRQGGTFWCTDVSVDLADAVEEHGEQYRGVCIEKGYRTLAIVPIRFRGGIVGAIHVADERPGVMGRDEAALMEAVGPLIGEAMNRFDIEDELHRHYDLQSVTAAILKLSLENPRLERVLEEAVSLVLRVPWFASQGKGAIVMVDAGSGQMCLVAQQGLSGEQKRLCEKRGHDCPCGIAARTGRLTHIESVGGEAAGCCAGTHPHGLYCVPVKAAGRVLAVLTVYVDAGHRREEREVELLLAVADILAGVIQRKRFEEQLREREERFRQLAENINEVFWLARAGSGALLYVSPAAESVFGKRPPESETLSAMMEELVHPDDTQRVRGVFTSCEGEGNVEYRVVTAAGATRWVRTRIFPIKDRLGSVFRIAGLTADITAYKVAAERERLHKEQLIQADKMASLGILVSGVAHEINNPNNLIMLNADVLAKAWRDALPILDEHATRDEAFMLNGLPYGEIRAEFDMLLDGIARGSERIQNIVHNLKDFVRVDTGRLDQDVDVNAVIESAIFIVGNLVKKATRRFSWTPAGTAPVVRGNAQQLEQVVINLMTNACQALESTDAAIEVSTACDGDTIRIRVTDEGAGIAAEDLQRVMDPFYTTKRDTGGTGLGLSVSYGIVQAHGGVLRFESKLGTGTTAIVELPKSR